MEKILKYGIQSFVLVLILIKGHSILLEKAEVIKNSGVDITHIISLISISLTAAAIPVILYTLYCTLMTVDSFILILSKKYHWKWYR